LPQQVKNSSKHLPQQWSSSRMRATSSSLLVNCDSLMFLQLQTTIKPNTLL
jgi:hypothetical protein